MASVHSHSITHASNQAPSDLGLEEIMRVMDVATTLRHEQESVEREFNLDETKQRLSEKLIRTAELTGESLTEEQVATAVSWYYDNLHEYQEPRKSFIWYFAHLYVRRIKILTWAIPLVLVTTFVWAMWLAPFAPYSTRNVKRRRIDTAFKQIESRINSIRSISQSPATDTTIDQLELESKTHYSNLDADRLLTLSSRLEDIDTRINEVFTITIVGGENQRSGFERHFEDDQSKRISGYYLVVQARSAEGKALTREIRNAETDTLHHVSKWAERVPQTVYDRLVKDKTEDGVLNETIFATKIRGMVDIEMVIPDDNNVPIRRTAQITDW